MLRTRSRSVACRSMTGHTVANGYTYVRSNTDTDEQQDSKQHKNCTLRYEATQKQENSTPLRDPCPQRTQEH